MAWWDHEELKSPEDRSDRYIVTFPKEYSNDEVQAALLRLKKDKVEAKDSIIEVKDSPSAPFIGLPTNLKFDEGRYLEELKQYIAHTYEAHYGKGGTQTFELMVSGGKADGFTTGSIMKYAARYGEKDGYNRSDLLKIAHYALLQLYVHDKHNRG